LTFTISSKLNVCVPLPGLTTKGTSTRVGKLVVRLCLMVSVSRTSLAVGLKTSNWSVRKPFQSRTFPRVTPNESPAANTTLRAFPPSSAFSSMESRVASVAVSLGSSSRLGRSRGVALGPAAGVAGPIDSPGAIAPPMGVTVRSTGMSPMVPVTL
jgi:hypothetical protein